MAKHDNERLQMYISVTNITIVICWISLLSFWAIKLMGGNWFEIVVTNQNFIAFSNFVQNTWAKYIVSFITIVTLRYVFFGAILQKFVFKGKQLVVISAILISLWAVVNFMPAQFQWFSSSFGYVITILLAIIYNKGIKKTFGVVAVIADIAFSALSMLTRSVELQIVTDYLLLLILCIDIYIMATLYYLYSNLIRLKKGG